MHGTLNIKIPPSSAGVGIETQTRSKIRRKVKTERRKVEMLSYLRDKYENKKEKR
jgi:hypothetical protein